MSLYSHSSRPSHSDEERREDPCSLCRTVHGVFRLRLNRTHPAQYSYIDFSDDILKQFFHDDCSKCLDIDMDSLCPPCKHMRLGHLLRCVLPGFNPEAAKPGYKTILKTGVVDLNLGTLRELQKRSTSCQTCRTFVYQASVLADRFESATDEVITLSVQRKPGVIRGIRHEFTIQPSLGRSFVDARFAKSTTFLATIDPASGNNLISLQRPQPKVNWSAVSSWLQECDNNTEHENPCRPEVRQLPVQGFRVIDVEKRRVVLSSQPCRYATLTTTKNIRHLETEGSLTKENYLSATIDDAIYACSRLQIPFLWRSDQKTAQLNAMGQIYRQSYLTLIAIAGSDTNYGLPGTQGQQRCPQWTGQTQGIYLESKWSSRGWTFQESGVFYQCRPRTHFKDEDHGDQELGFSIAQMPLSSYEDLSDILDAFSGVLHLIYGVEHHYGLPFSDFSRAILWVTEDGRYPMRPPCISKTFPSWSWSSIDNAIAPASAQWAIPPRYTQSFLKILPNPSTQQHELDDDSKKVFPYSQEHILARLAVLMAWKGGCFPGTLPDCLNEGTWEQYDTIIRQRWGSLAGMTDEAYCMQGGHLTAHEQETRFPIQMQHACTDGCIMLFTQSKRLQIRENKEYEQAMKLFDQDSGIVGWLTHHSINWERLRKIPSWNCGAEFDVLALSISYQTRWVNEIWGFTAVKEYGREASNWYDSAGKCYFIEEDDDKEYPWISLPCVNLMVVETKNGIRRRIALAEAPLKIWIESKPEFHTFILG
ncbi:hypothetical protein BDV37DRAFT_291688 [Aspergillus pseudonomiae]|uniref:Heterokaryon incompatibility domain-containing protein n=1 Tax=Aspergillus pseudonomiae TaxID=1506151 RepID=A0A5N7CUF2_9EURO|nr:uncharacterized protein BDV37DRAFT_291688 [Aspergillus pseudonomiae]KAE8397754.1 hypothetical protein BDV37DRAFT_291688 [Aspergillus pseudonomiae]